MNRTLEIRGSSDSRDEVRISEIPDRDQTLMSALAWIDFDQTDRDRARRIMDLFAQLRQ